MVAKIWGHSINGFMYTMEDYSAIRKDEKMNMANMDEP